MKTASLSMIVILSKAKPQRAARRLAANLSLSVLERQSPFAALRVTRDGGGKL
jgi:hypothetical protein